MHPKDLSIREFYYTLPEDRIARYPLDDRDASRLLVFKNGHIHETTYSNIANEIPAGSLLVFNNTKVVEARILFSKPTGAVIEIFCLEPHEKYPDIAAAMTEQGSVLWKCLVGGASKWKRGQVLEKIVVYNGDEHVLRASYIEKRSDHFIIELSWSPASLSFAGILHAAGAVPLPPYIKREADTTDTERYQTIYARFEGSVAAPTAGLHFTDSIFDSFKTKNIQHDFVTLHVGAGTFKPVKSDKMEAHEMHAEFIDVTKNTIRNILQQLPVIAVGTTSMRTLESLYWLGVKAASGQLHQPLTVRQWEPYDPTTDIPASGALQALIDWMTITKIDRIIASTQIIIAPGYRPRVCRALVTNFHQPGSTLLLLVAALTGQNWKYIYDYALENDFRFLSYGDGCLLWVEVHGL